MSSDGKGPLGLHRNVFVLGLTSSVATFANTLWIFFFPLLLSQGGFAASAIGAVYALQTLLGAAVRVPVGAFVDSFGRKPAVVIGTLIPSLSVLVFAVSTNAVVYSAAFVFLTAFGGAFFGIGMRAMIFESSTDKPATSFGAFTTMAGWASIFAPFLGSMFFAEGSTKVFLVSSFLYAAAAAGRATLLKETLRRDRAAGDGGTKRDRNPLRNLRALLREVLSNRALLFLTAAYAIYNLFTDQISFVVPLYSVEVLRFNATQVGILFSVFLLVDSQSRVLFGRLADRFGYARMIILSWAGEMAFMLAFVYSAGYVASLVLFSIWVAFGALDGPAIQALLGRVTKMESRGISVGAFDTVPMLLSVPAQLVSGILFVLSPQLPFLTNLAFGLAAFALFLIFVRGRSQFRAP